MIANAFGSMALVCVLCATRALAANGGPDALAAAAAKAARCDQGLCVVLGDADGKLSTALAKGSRFYVQALSGEREGAEKIRRTLDEAGLAGRSSAVWRRTPHLPYLDDLLNLVVANGWGRPELKGLTLSEIARVLCPGGVAVVGADAGLDADALLAEAGKLKLVKAEKLALPGAWIRLTKQMNPDFGEWTGVGGGPGLTLVSPDKAFTAPYREIRWCQGPTWGAFGTAAYAGGRSFHLESTYISPTANQLWLAARDAHNGCDLWREKITGGAGLCADEKRVYCADGKELVGRDAATGKVDRRYGPPAATSIGVMVSSLEDCLIVSGQVIEKETGKVRWSRRASCQPAGADGAVYVYDGQGVEAVKLADGSTLWKSAPAELSTPKNAFRVAISVRTDTVFLQRDSLQEPQHVLSALDRATGALRWSRPYAGTVLPYADAVYMMGQVNIKGNPGPTWTELDIKTGQEKRKLDPQVVTGARCWAPTATERFITSIEESFYFDRIAFKEVRTGRGVRSGCKIGPAFAYGLMYDLPHTCNCGTVLRGVSALSGGSALPKVEAAPALVSLGAAPAGAAAAPGDWPLYRGTPQRSSATATELPAELKPAWSAAVGKSALSQATGAAGRVFVAEPDAHRVVALDLATGKPAWTFVAEGRVPLPPTYHKGLALFADNAGWVYCLDAANGRLVWQLQAAPEQKYMGAFGQPESAWPVKSGVLVLGETACFSAGRTGITDGGITVYGVDPATGQGRWKKTLARLMPNDLLVGDGTNLFLERVRLSAADGNDAKLGRGWDEMVLQSHGYEQNAGNSILDLLNSSDPGQIWIRKSQPGNARGGGQAVAFDKERTVMTGRVAVPPKFTLTEAEVRAAGASTWTNRSYTHQMLGLVLAGPRVYCAGIPQYRDSEDKPALWILSSADGKELQKLPLDGTPVIDGLSAVGGRLLLSTADGRLMCFEKK
ncbi:MAG TPA: PQQ-binding-like beta-propeller repeat protein [Planctomycetota bacterium]|nr:PQQ-binding-like beta-propeller repeat protein [Planctomycetota bacterium]